MSRFRISACSANYGHADLFKVIDRLAELHYDGVEITVMYHAIPAETPAEQRRQIRRRLADAGIEASALHFIFPGGLKMTAAAAEERNKVVDHVGTVLDLAHDLEAPVVVIGGGGMRTAPAGVDKAVAVERVVEVFAGIARKAERAGVTACFEALNRFETQVGRSLAECSAYVDRIGSPALEVAGDTFHMNIEEASMADALAATGKRLGHLHLPDSHRLAPGGGHIDFPPILRALKAMDYGGYLSFELFWIAPDIPYLPTYELCDAENVKGIAHIRKLEAEL